jgi:hypothetical protein
MHWPRTNFSISSPTGSPGFGGPFRKQLAVVCDDLAEAEALIGRAAEHVEQEAERRQEAQRQLHEKTTEQNRLRFLPGARDVA